MHKKLITINDLVYCFNQIPNSKQTNEANEELRIILPKTSIVEGQEIYDSLLFQRLEDSNKFRLKTKVNIISP